MQADDASASLKTQNEKIVAQTPDTGGVFVVQDDGSIRHVPSGTICPANFQNVHFAHADIFSSVAGAGTDVGCDYARNNPAGSAVSKLTIFITKAPDGMTLDAAFARYNREIQAAYPGAVPMPQSLRIGDKKTGQYATDYRAAGYTVSIDGQNYHSELIVGLWNGWMLEVRATYAHSIIIVKDSSETSINDAKIQLFDIENPYVAFMSVRDSLQAHNVAP